MELRLRDRRCCRLMKAALMWVVLGFPALTSLADTDVEFSGTLVADPCQIEMDSLEQEINFGNIAAKTFINHNYSVAKSFSIHLTECDLSLGNQVSVTFLGEEDSTHPGTLAVTGSAKGISIRMTDSEGRLVAPNEAQPVSGLHAGDTILEYQARIQAQDFSQVSEGDFSAVTTFVLVWE